MIRAGTIQRLWVETGGLFWLGSLLVGLLALQTLLPAAHPEVRLFSDNWGSAQFYASACATPDDDLIRGDALPPLILNTPPVVRQLQDAASLSLHYLSWGLLLPLLAAGGVLRHGARQPGWLLFAGMGLSAAWFQWPLNPAFVILRQELAEFWLARWPMTEAGFVWLDGATLMLWLGAGTLLLGGACLVALCVAAFLTGLDWRRLAVGTVPLAAVLVFLGTTQQTALFLHAEGVALDGLPGLRAALLALAVTLSARQGWRLIGPAASSLAGRIIAGLFFMLPAAVLVAHGFAMYFHWTDRFHV